MSQEAKLTINGWYQRHDYDSVLQRLSKVRRVTLTGDLEKGAENLRKSYHFAVLSIKNSKDIHEEAYRLWADEDKHLMDAAIEAGVNFRNNKVAWMKKTDHAVDWQTLLIACRRHVRNGRLSDLLGLCDHLNGVHYKKWGFTLAMAGVWELVCIDSNVKQQLGIEGRLDLRKKDGMSKYFELRDEIQSSVEHALPPFVCQWVMYDMSRGEHATHDPYFDTVYPFV